MPVGIALGRLKKDFNLARPLGSTLVTRKDRLYAYGRGQGAILHRKMVNPIQGPQNLPPFDESARHLYPLTTRQDPVRSEKMMFLKGRRLFRDGNFDGLRVNILRRAAGFIGALKWIINYINPP